ncbi:unnamed protein product [Moneuplotes crassus]|uniref:Uncharacterized protein n=1 Tax=Euplotes crassus TaxID=5936 RepID=A0AAD1XA02_EUPCR|nr:unnamed protein product [Moneuplotes crassus]
MEKEKQRELEEVNKFIQSLGIPFYKQELATGGLDNPCGTVAKFQNKIKQKMFRNFAIINAFKRGISIKKNQKNGESTVSTCESEDKILGEDKLETDLNFEKSEYENIEYVYFKNGITGITIECGIPQLLVVVSKNMVSSMNYEDVKANMEEVANFFSDFISFDDIISKLEKVQEHVVAFIAILQASGDKYSLKKVNFQDLADAVKPEPSDLEIEIDSKEEFPYPDPFNPICIFTQVKLNDGNTYVMVRESSQEIRIYALILEDFSQRTGSFFDHCTEINEKCFEGVIITSFRDISTQILQTLESRVESTGSSKILKGIISIIKPGIMKVIQ